MASRTLQIRSRKGWGFLFVRAVPLELMPEMSFELSWRRPLNLCRAPVNQLHFRTLFIITLAAPSRGRVRTDIALRSSTVLARLGALDNHWTYFPETSFNVVPAVPGRRATFHD